MPEGSRSPVLVFDLDGTVLRINSFPRWLLFLMGGRIPGLDRHRRLRLSLRVMSLLVPRKMGLMDHDTLLRHTQQAWWAETSLGQDGLVDGFQMQLLRHVRPNLRSLLEQVARDRVDAVLATAASAEYASGLGHRLGFRHILATPSRLRSDEPPNRGCHKRDGVLGFMNRQGWAGRPMILLTDHLDDLPLIRESILVCWFGTAKHMQVARTRAGGTRIIFCRDLNDDSLLLRLGVMAAGA